MITEEDIRQMAAMMHIPIDDQTKYVQKFLDHFGTLDEAGVDDEEIRAMRVDLSNLRKDVHHRHGADMAGHVRAPRPG